MSNRKQFSDIVLPHGHEIKIYETIQFQPVLLAHLRTKLQAVSITHYAISSSCELEMLQADTCMNLLDTSYICIFINLIVFLSTPCSTKMLYSAPLLFFVNL
jgi:hypothetical protein